MSERKVFCKLLTFFLVDKHRVASAFLSEVRLVSAHGATCIAHSGSTGLVGVGTTLEVELAGEVGAHGFRRGLQAKRRRCWRQIRWVLGSIAFGLRLHVLFLRDQVVDTLLVLNHLYLSLLE